MYCHKLIHSSALAWRIPGTGEPGGLLSMGLRRVGHNWSDLAAAAAAAGAFPGGPVAETPCSQCRDLGLIPIQGTIWRKKWQPTPEYLPEESHRERSLVGYSPWGCKELYTTERLNWADVGIYWDFNKIEQSTAEQVDSTSLWKPQPLKEYVIILTNWIPVSIGGVVESMGSQRIVHDWWLNWLTDW